MIVSSWKHRLRLLGNPRLLNKIVAHDFIYKYFPGFCIGAEKEKSEYNLKFVKTIRDPKLLEKDKNTFAFSYNSKTSIEDLITIIDYIFDLIRQRDNSYVMHGSAVSKNKKGIIFWGQVSGLGKTSLAIRLCKSHDYSFVGDEKILLDGKMRIVSALQTLSYNKVQLKTFLGNEFDNLSKKELSRVIRIAKLPIPADIFIQPLICPGGHTEVIKWDNLKGNYHMYEELTRKIRGNSRRVNKYKVPIQSLDSQMISSKRSLFTRKLGSKKNFYTIKGSIENVITKINELIGR